MEDFIQVFASLMCCNPLILGNEIHNLQRANCDGFHVDIMDGSFVKNFAMNIRELQFIRNKTHLPIDAHVMIYNPSQYIKALAAAGTNRIVIHPESCQDYLTVLQNIRHLGVKAGLALSPHSRLEHVNPQVLPLIDTVLVMGVMPGFAGQSFIPETINRVREIRARLCQFSSGDIVIEVDGAISAKTIPTLYVAGARKFVGGSSGLFYGNVSYPQAIKRLKKSISNLNKAKYVQMSGKCPSYPD